MVKTMKNKDQILYKPMWMEIKNILPQMPDHNLFQLKFLDKNMADRFSHEPGQFLEVSIPGVGEAPISISSPPTRLPELEICVRKVGSLTSALFKKDKGDKIAIRGPLGRGFPVDTFKGNNVLLVAGGLGLAPLRSLLYAILDNRNDFKNITLLYGARNPDNILFKYELLSIMSRKDIEYHFSVDMDLEGIWRQYVGLITGLFKDLQIDSENTFCVLCGPPIMYRFVIEKLKSKGISSDKIYVSLERTMRCGVGKCGHCTIGEFYCCTDGPVFCLKDIEHIKEAI